MRKLTKKQLEVMKVLWDNNRPMISSEIEKSDPSFNSGLPAGIVEEGLYSGRRYCLQRDCPDQELPAHLHKDGVSEGCVQ